MALPAQNINNSTIRSILEKENLIGPNFTNSYRNLRIVLRYEKKLVHLEQPLPLSPNPETVAPREIEAYLALLNSQQEVAYLMLASMSPKLQKNLENYNAYDMLEELKTMFEEQAKQELFERLHAMLKLAEKGIPKQASTLVVLVIREGKIQKNKNNFVGIQRFQDADKDNDVQAQAQSYY
ncbi:hypothetical protein Tco_0533960 [Tanacetum coccineum]